MASKRSLRRLRQETERAVERGEQHRLTNLLNDRVRKPRTFTTPLENAAKRQKTSHSAAEALPASVLPAPSIPVPAVQHSAITSTEQLESQKKKWRLSEILNKERHSKRMRQSAQPSFILAPPHMDTRRPPTAGSKRSDLSSTSKPQNTKKSSPKPKPNSAASLLAAQPVPSSSRTTSIPGGDALLYDKSMLPKSYALVLDTLIGLETAVSLLRVRKMRPTVGALRDIVARTTRRDFTMKALSQLAHIVPEAVAVLPGPKITVNPKRPYDSLIVRLDRPDDDRDQSGKENNSGDTKSSLGEGHARLRRSLLHKRLLQRVREHHDSFLDRISETRYKGDVWHPDFDLENEVSELPSPALYSDESSRAAVRSVKRVRFNLPDADKSKDDEDQNPTSPDEDEEDSADGCIPKSLLERVRARSKYQREQESKQVEEKKSNESLLSKLPSTMDSIYIVMRNEKRSAMGWSQLILKLEKLHPKKWGRDDLQKQVDAIVLLSPEWCKKVELKSSRGGHAFRIVSESAFNACREKISSTKHHDFSVDQ
ncbi:DNA replication factor Cdt1 [Gracilaria domingensis]|nr:DNA replication factor Cdt1 [Gracilaria domingensis]